MSRDRRKALVKRGHARLSVAGQCRLVSVARSTFYFNAKGESSENLRLMRIIDEQYMKTPWYGSRQMTRCLRRQGHLLGRKRAGRLMRKMGLTAIYQAPGTSTPHPGHRVYPYLLGGVSIEHADHVWSTDITYIPMRRGFMYLVAIMDWSTRAVLSWRLSNTMDPGFCVEALEEALARYGKPRIFNTDQGSQFTSLAFTDVLRQAGIKISMDGKGRWLDNVFIERLWRSLKYECVYLRDFEDGFQARKEIGLWLKYYNEERPHSSLCDDRTPLEAYKMKKAA